MGGLSDHAARPHAGAAPATLTALAVLVALAVGCSFDASTRDDFVRDVPLPDAGSCASEALAWRATTVTVEMPAGLAVFQPFIDDAVDTDNLNFLIAQSGEDFVFDESPWPLQIGDADARGGCYAMSEADPPALTSATVDVAAGDARPLETPADLTFTVIARLPFAVPVPLTAARLTAVVRSDGSALESGVAEGVITAEVASMALIDLQSDGDPANDTPLISFLGDPDTDLDGDGIVDDFAARFLFESTPASLVQP
jgi:hypothetical protein